MLNIRASLFSGDVYWAVTVAIDDLVFENGMLGLSVGQQPKVTDIDNGELAH